ncbi:hypothetical protein MHU86_372 [Fragilaria crotonensis]|nr:hypothetical protein MHU86_372 [Fragilaria crotonensis]
MKNAIPPTLALASLGPPLDLPEDPSINVSTVFLLPTLPLMTIRINQPRRRGAPPSRKVPAAYHANNSDDNFDQIIQEDRNLHFNERNNKIAAPSPQGTNISHRATTPTKMAAKMQPLLQLLQLL